jgi:thiol-disulfide isomerase/thioredoxin
MYNDNLEAIAGMIPELEKATTNFNPDESRFFNDLQTFQGLLTGVRALDARLKEDPATFEKLIKDAFWQSPQLAPIYGRWAREYQLDRANDEAMAKITVPLDVPLASVDGTTQTLKQLAGNNKAILIDVWATWCPFCMEAMPNLPGKAKRMALQGVAFVSLNTGDQKDTIEKVKKGANLDFPMVMEPEELPYSKLLGLVPLPRMVLVTPEGRLLFNGHPDDPKLQRVLKKLGVEL